MAKHKPLADALQATPEAKPKPKAPPIAKPAEQKIVQRKPATKAEPVTASKGPRLLTAKTEEAMRTALYLHPDDFRALAMAKAEDRVDMNTRVRSMIAFYREDPAFKAAVDKLATGTQRGPHRQNDLVS